MREAWVDELLADAPPAQAEFREGLRDRVLDAWDDRELDDEGDREQRGRWVWPLFVAAAVATVVVAGLVVLADRDRPAGPSDTSTVPSASSDIVGVWFVTELDGVPLRSPLPTYRFTDDGAVSGFDGCNRFATTGSVDGGSLRVGEVAASAAISCVEDGAPVPTVSLSGAVLELADGSDTMVIRGEGTARAWRADALASPSRLEGGTWVYGLHGEDLRLQFRDDLTAGVDEADDCGRASYTYTDGTLQLGPFEGDRATCPRGSLGALYSLDGLQLQVVEFADAYSESIVLVTPTNLAVRLFPGGESETVEATVVEATVEAG